MGHASTTQAHTLAAREAGKVGNCHFPLPLGQAVFAPCSLAPLEDAPHKEFRRQSREEAMLSYLCAGGMGMSIGHLYSKTSF